MFAVPSALTGLTSLFGMGRGGSPTLSIALMSEKRSMTVYRNKEYMFLTIFKQTTLLGRNLKKRNPGAKLWRYAPELVARYWGAHKKAFGQLVLLDWTHCCAYICSLSTSWSTTTLMRKSNLVVGFALRCFQRLSRPDADTQRCSWRNNW